MARLKMNTLTMWNDDVPVDGIYFQTTTEHHNRELADRSLAAWFVMREGRHLSMETLMGRRVVAASPLPLTAG